MTANGPAPAPGEAVGRTTATASAARATPALAEDGRTSATASAARATPALAEDGRTSASSDAPVTVVGVGTAELPPLARERLARAELVAGGARQLADHAPAGVSHARFGGDLAPALNAVAGCAGPAVVLASGDPGFFGIVRALAERVGPERLEVLPAPSSVAVAFARIGVPWDDALVVSAHGRAPAAAVNAARAHPKVAVLTAPGFGPAELARGLAGLSRELVVAERLGEAGERVTRGTPEEIAAGVWEDPNVVLALDPAALVGPKGTLWPARGPTGWALPEEAFEHRGNMITKQEVRALALSRLGPGVGDLVWDVGTGSGAVGVECARFGAAVIALDADPEECGRARANAERHGVHVDVRHGRAPAALAGLPDPNAVFVGGGGDDLLEIVDVAAARARRAVVVTLAMLERVVPAAERLERAGWDVEATMLHAARVRGVAGLHRLQGLNPTFVVAGWRR